MRTHCSTAVLRDEPALNDLCFLVSGCGITLGKHRLHSGLQEHGQHDRATQTLPEAATITQGPKCRDSHHSFCTQGLYACQAEHPQDSKRRVKVSPKMRHSTHACFASLLSLCTALLVSRVQSGCPAAFCIQERRHSQLCKIYHTMQAVHLRQKPVCTPNAYATMEYIGAIVPSRHCLQSCCCMPRSSGASSQTLAKLQCTASSDVNAAEGTTTLLCPAHHLPLFLPCPPLLRLVYLSLQIAMNANRLQCTCVSLLP